MVLHNIILDYLPYPVKQIPAAQPVKLNATEEYQQPNYGILSLRMTSLESDARQQTALCKSTSEL